MGSRCIEASKLASFSSVRVSIERYFRLAHSSKAFLLLNSFIRVAMFELVIFLEHFSTLPILLFQLMMILCKFLGTVSLGLTILHTKREGV